MSYQKRDAHIIDYEVYPFNGYELRSPRIDTAKPYIACIGAAQTFGPFCKKPFPTLLASKLGIQVLNLGIAGAIPAQFLTDNILGHINKSKFAIIQILSGRCGSNSYYTHVQRSVGIIHEGYRVAAPFLFWTEAEKKYDNDLLNKLVEETRRDYIYQMLALIRSVKVPKILFYFSKYKPENLPAKLSLSPFPQLLTRWMVEEIAGFCDEYVECVSSVGLPQKLYDKNGKPTYVKRSSWDEVNPPMSQNDYYPSPEMHIEAANALELKCRTFLEKFLNGR